MPRDSHLLSPMSRALLRAARSGCIYIRPASKDLDDEEKEATDPEEQQSQQNFERNFAMRKWATVPKHLEAPEVEFLAKRRPGLPSLYGATAGAVDGANGSVPMRKTRFKKVDPATGNVSIYAAWVPEGHKIEGEITDEAQIPAEDNQATVIPEAPAPGTVIEGVGVVNAQGVVVAEAGSAAVLTPPRRRPPPPKRKAKGLKGRRKKVMFAPGEGADASLVHGAGAGAGDSAANYERETDPSRLSVDQTTQDDEDDEGEEGEESDDGEGEDSGLEAKTPETPGPQPSTEPEPEQASTPMPIKVETPTESQTPHPPKPESESEPQPGVEAPPSAAHPALSENAPAGPPGPTNPTSSDQHKETTATAAKTEDIEMADSIPTDNALRSSSIPASETRSETQQQTIPDAAQPVSTGKALSPSQGAKQSPAPGPATAETTGEQTEEPVDVTMAEPDESGPEPPRDQPVSMDMSTEAPKSSLADQAQDQDSAPQQSGGNEFDLLDSLEASLENVPKETPVGEQKETTLEQEPGDTVSQEAAPVPEPAAPAQPPVEEPAETKPAETNKLAPKEPTTPLSEQLTPSDAEQTTTVGTTEASAAQQVQQPSTEHRQSEDAPQAPAHPEHNPSDEPAVGAETAQPITKQSEQNHQEPVSEQTPSENPSLPEATAEPSAGQDRPQESTSGPAAEAQVDVQATSEQEQQTVANSEAPAQPPAAPVAEIVAEPTPEEPQISAQEPPQEPAQPQAEPVTISSAEPSAEQQHEASTSVVGKQGASGSPPSPTQ